GVSCLYQSPVPVRYSLLHRQIFFRYCVVNLMGNTIRIAAPHRIEGAVMILFDFALRRAAAKRAWFQLITSRCSGRLASSPIGYTIRATAHYVITVFAVKHDRLRSLFVIPTPSSRTLPRKRTLPGPPPRPVRPRSESHPTHTCSFCTPWSNRINDSFLLIDIVRIATPGQDRQHTKRDNHHRLFW